MHAADANVKAGIGTHKASEKSIVVIEVAVLLEGDFTKDRVVKKRDLKVLSSCLCGQGGCNW